MMFSTDKTALEHGRGGNGEGWESFISTVGGVTDDLWFPFKVWKGGKT